MNRWFKRALIVAVVALVIVGLRLTVFRPDPVRVSVHRVERGRVEDTVVNTRAGTVESRQRSQMSPGIAGLVAEVPVEKGAVVEAGAVLLRLDDSEQAARVDLTEHALDAAHASEQEACSRAEQAAREERRVSGLAAQSLVSDQQLEEAVTASAVTRAACEAARERARQAESELAAARVTLDKTVISAPFDGVVLDVTTEVGEWISPSPPGVFIPAVIDLIDPTDLYVEAPIDEVDVERVRVGLPVRITLDAFAGREFAGSLTYRASFVETQQEQNRTLSVEAVFDEASLPSNLVAGLSADVEIILEAHDDVLRVPTYALLEGNHVLVLRDGELVEVEVEIGLRNWAFTEVVSGLEEGDPVVVSLDRAAVRAGARAEIADAASP